MIIILSVRLLDDRFHGLAENGEKPNWPPSPFRLFQAILAGNARAGTIAPGLVDALEWLETLDPPEITLPTAEFGKPLLTYVLNNSEGRSRTPKIIRPTVLNGDRLIEFGWHFEPTNERSACRTTALTNAVGHLSAFGWGIDLAIGYGYIMERDVSNPVTRIRYVPAQDVGFEGVELRVPRSGSLASLQECYRQFVGRFQSKEITMLESGGPTYQLQRYVVKFGRPHAVFRLLDENGDTVHYPQAKLVHIAGMTRHLAIERMRANPPHDLRGRDPAEWLQAYVSGHQPADAKASGAAHSQFSYVPLQSVGASHTDPSVRRVMIIAPAGDEPWLDHLAEQLDGLELKPLPNTNLPPGTRLERISEKVKDGVRDSYVAASRAWASVTPVILPGHDDHKPEKTRRLIERALAQSGLEYPCEFEWSAYSRLPKMLSVHKYRREYDDPTKRIRVNYVRPDHSLEQSAVHLAIRFGRREAPGDSQSVWIPAVHPVPGPICIGAGRHCGFGVMTAVRD